MPRNDKPADQPTDRLADEPADEPADQAAGKSTDRPVDQPVDKWSARPAKNPVDKSTDQAGDEPADQPVDKSSARPARNPVDNSTAQAADEPADQAADQAADKSTNQPADKLVDKSTNQPADKLVDKSADELVHQAAAKSTGKLARQPADTPGGKPAGQPADKPVLCVAIHDLAPATWPECLRLLRTIRAVADIPVTWLAVPRWHGSGAVSRACEATLTRLLGEGHEIALHGYTHLDGAAPPRGWRSRFVRRVYTEGEGEFAALGAAEAQRRIDLGLAWCTERGWPVAGFVAPAWLLSDEAWQAVRGYGFAYTTTWSHFHVLAPQRALFSPALVYAARNRTGRLLSPHAAGALARLLGGAPLLRLALHPRDAHHPALLRHAQDLIARLLQTREALTKGAFAHRLAGTATSTAPNILPSTSANVLHPRNNEGSHSAEDHPWR